MKELIRVLLVDDDEQDFILVRKHLAAIEGVRYDLDWALGYDSALEMIQAHNFHIYIIDYLLGDKDGHQLLQEIVRNGDPSPVIILTGYSEKDMGESSIRYGAEDFLPKQELSPTVLDRVIRHSIRRKQAEVDLRESESRYKELAEFSNAALHNIGNLMNSINLSNDRVEEELLNSKIKLMNKVGDMISKNDNRPEFFSEDERGRLIFQRMTELFGEIDRERLANLDEVSDIRKKISMMKDAVTQQQNFAKRCIGSEDLDLRLLVAEVLEIKGETLENQGVEIDTCFETDHRVRCHQVKMAHVLINLVKNASEAMEHSAGEKALKISTMLSDAGEVLLSVTDTGVGMEPLQLRGLFKHGFTTKVNGHGFGLNYCARVMRDMGGDIKVHSDGVGKGATFTLVFPTRLDLDSEINHLKESDFAAGSPPAAI